MVEVQITKHANYHRKLFDLTYTLEVEMSDKKVSVSDSVNQGDAKSSVLGGARVGPVLGALDFHLLHQVSQHHHCRHVVVPDHAPEVTDSVRQGTLSSYVLLLTIITLSVGKGREELMVYIYRQELE